MMFASCKAIKTTSSTGNASKNTNTRVIISTQYGDIKVLLYDKTPVHRDNFIKLVRQKTLDSTIFHRVIANFMIQGGNIATKTSKPGVPVVEGDIGYTLPAEIVPGIFHKRGALAAAREGDIINPKMESSGSQFYIVHGAVFSDTMLYEVAKRVTRMHAYNKVINLPENKSLFESLQRSMKDQRQDSMAYYNQQLENRVEKEVKDSKPYAFTPEQKAAYRTTGGAPHLDGTYTVFGEVTEGFEVLDKIANLPVDKRNNHRPLKDVRMSIRLENESK